LGVEASQHAAADAIVGHLSEQELVARKDSGDVRHLGDSTGGDSPYVGRIEAARLDEVVVQVRR